MMMIIILEVSILVLNFLNNLIIKFMENNLLLIFHGLFGGGAK